MIDLRPTERIATRCMGHRRLKSGERAPVSILLIEGRGDESCIFLLGSDGSLVKILPILADFRLLLSQSKAATEQPDRSNGDFILRLMSGSVEAKVHIFELKALQQLLARLKTCMGKARTNNYTTKFEWISFYDGDVSIEDSPVTAVSPSSMAIEENPFILPDLTSAIENSKSIKESWTASRLRARETEFANFEIATIFCGTWNVNGNSASEDIRPWLLSAVEGSADVVVLGFQELDNSAEAYIVNDQTKDADWCNAIENVLAGGAKKYVKIASKQLIGIFIVVYAMSDHVDHITEVTTESVATGFLGLMGNKGAAGCRLRYQDSYLCFVNSHLAADTNQVEKRNQDHGEIIKRLQFPLQKYDQYKGWVLKNPWIPCATDNAGTSDVFSNIPAKNFAGITDADHSLWLGDLNYRIPIPEADAKKMLAEGKLSELLQHDQLFVEMKAGRAFNNFEEPVIRFAPTYKYDVGTSRYDTSEKRRSPSWCDRILVHRNPLRLNDEEWIVNRRYESTMELTLSDHKPLGSLFTAKIRRIDHGRFEAVSADISRTLDVYENAARPDLRVSCNHLEFGSVVFGVTSTRSFVVENAGQVAAEFMFVPRPGETASCKPWCFINPPSAFLLPGQRKRVMVTMLVSNGRAAVPLNLGIEQLEDTLIVHTKNGRDEFVSVSGSWRPSSFGNDLTALCNMANPISSYDPAEIREKLSIASTVSAQGGVDVSVERSMGLVTLADSPSSAAAANVAANGSSLSIPKEIWVLVDFLFKFGTDVDKLFDCDGDADTVEYIRTCIDTGVPLDLEALLLDPPPMPEGHEPPKTDIGGSGGGGGVENDSAASSPIVFPDDASTTGEAMPQTLSSPTSNSAAASRNDGLRVKTSVGLQFKGRWASVRSAAEVLIELLASLNDPVVPATLYQRCIQEGYLSVAAARQVVRAMPSAHHNVFVYLISFLRELASAYTGTGRLTTDRIAAVFAPVLMRSETFVHIRRGADGQRVPAAAAAAASGSAKENGRSPSQASSTTANGSTAMMPVAMTRIESIGALNRGASANESRQRIFIQLFLDGGDL